MKPPGGGWSHADGFGGARLWLLCKISLGCALEVQSSLPASVMAGRLLCCVCVCVCVCVYVCVALLCSYILVATLS
jgi:hypothetical protein